MISEKNINELLNNISKSVKKAIRESDSGLPNNYTKEHRHDSINGRLYGDAPFAVPHNYVDEDLRKLMIKCGYDEDKQLITYKDFDHWLSNKGIGIMINGSYNNKYDKVFVLYPVKKISYNSIYEFYRDPRFYTVEVPFTNDLHDTYNLGYTKIINWLMGEGRWLLNYEIPEADVENVESFEVGEDVIACDDSLEIRNEMVVLSIGKKWIICAFTHQNGETSVGDYKLRFDINTHKCVNGKTLYHIKY